MKRECTERGGFAEWAGGSWMRRGAGRQANCHADRRADRQASRQLIRRVGLLVVGGLLGTAWLGDVMLDERGRVEVGPIELGPIELGLVKLGSSASAATRTSAMVVAAQDAGPTGRPDLGVRRPADPPATRYAAAAIETAADEHRALLRRLAPSAGDAGALVSAADALRAVVLELALASDTATPAGRADVVLATQLMAESGHWDALFRRQLAGDEASAASVAAFVEALDSGPETGRVPARERLAGAARTLLSSAVGFGSAAAMMDAVIAAGDRDALRGDSGTGTGVGAHSTADELDPIAVAARLDAAMDEATWLGTDAQRLMTFRREDVAAAMSASELELSHLAASVIEAVNDSEPRGRRRARFRSAVRTIIDRWPDGAAAVVDPTRAPRPANDAEPVSDAETREAWTRLGRVAELSARRTMIGARPAPPNLPVELRRLGRVLYERAEEADLAAIDALAELIYGPGAVSDPALVSIVSGMQQSIDRMDWLAARAGWLDTAGAIDAELRAPAQARVDEWLVQLGSSSLRVEAGRRLSGLAGFLTQAGDDAASTRIGRAVAGDGEMVLAELLAGDGAALQERRKAAVRGRLGLLLGQPAAADAEAAESLALLARQLVAVADARADVERWGPGAADASPDAMFPAGGDAIVGAAERAVRQALGRALSAAPPAIIDAVVAAREPVAGARAWADAAPRWGVVPGGPDLATVVLASSDERPRAGGADADRESEDGAADRATSGGRVPASLLAACVPPARADLAALSWHVLEAAAARAENDGETADAHVAMAGWIRGTAFAADRAAEADGGW
ncbi:MAG: hypothetical protein AB8G96_14695 [Phycisphaerales bacterium]